MTAAPETRLGLPIIGFADEQAFLQWLSVTPRTAPGIWLKLVKKGAGVPGISKAAALDAALCHGWIDGQQHPYDDHFWLTRFTPRLRASRWSQVNRKRALELIAEGRMTAAGLAEVDAAKLDGRWHAAYAPSSSAQPCPDLQAALDASPLAARAFAALKRADQYAILYRMNNLKTERGRANAVADIVLMLLNSQAGLPSRDID